MMPSPRFPATATLLDAKACPLDKFDPLFVKITQERRVLDGYFMQAHPDETWFLFVVNGAPYGAGRLAADASTFGEIHEFFAAYSGHPQSPLSFFVADKRLLLGLMVLFRHRPTLQFTTDLVDMDEVLKKLAARGTDAIVAIRAREEWALSICTKGKPVANFFPPSGAEALKEPTTGEQLLVYVFTRPPGGVTVDVYEETRVNRAGDASLVTAETRGRMSQVFLRVAARVAEEAVPHLELEQAVEPDLSQKDAEVFVASAPPADAAGGVVEETPLSVPPPAAPTVAPEPVPPAPTPSIRGPIPEVFLFLGDKQLGTFSLAKGELTIGRNPTNDILIDNAGVSRRHAVIKMSGERVTVEDLGSANGTFVSGQKITSHELKDGNEIQVLKHRLVFRVPKEATVPKPEIEADVGQKTMFIDSSAIAQAAVGKAVGKPESAAPRLRPCLILPDRRKMPLESEEITLGTAPDCKIQVSGMFVAKLHARIVPEKEGQFKLLHVAGLAGTRVNGEKISERVLKHGDEIEIGKQKLLFRLER
jgi:pSer/pThr/pTyr-binding forkhead associated (FHA) protein